MLNSSECKFLFLCATRRKAPCFPAEPLLGSEVLEHVDSYHYLNLCQNILQTDNGLST